MQRHTVWQRWSPKPWGYEQGYELVNTGITEMSKDTDLKTYGMVALISDDVGLRAGKHGNNKEMRKDTDLRPQRLFQFVAMMT